MSTTTLAAPAVPPIESETDDRPEQAMVVIFKDITRDPEFWKQAVMP